MLRTIAISLAQAVAIVLFSGTCYFLASYLVEKHSFDYGPLFLLILYVMPIAVAAESAGVTYRELKVLNPCLVSDVIPKGAFTLRVPEGKGKRFEQDVEVWKSTFKPSVLVHKVSRGDTLDSIAQKYNSTRQQI